MQRERERKSGKNEREREREKVRDVLCDLLVASIPWP
jgi:hypothetical protein